MTAERWQRIQEQGGVADLSARAKWLLTGADRVRYLNGQVTQDVRRVRPDLALHACVTDAKGRLCGDLFVRVTPDGEGLLADAAPALREVLGARLERYIVADDVELRDVTEDWRLLHFFGPAAARAPAAACECRRFGVAGRDAWLPAGAEAEENDFLTEDELETLRVLRGIPAHPGELHEGVFPPEAGLEAETMDYAKGCYIGQEVLSRIRSTGKMPRVLVKWLAASQPVAEGAAMTDPASGATLGQVTRSVTHPATGRACGLGYIKQGALPADSRLLVGGDMANILPLDQDFPS